MRVDRLIALLLAAAIGAGQAGAALAQSEARPRLILQNGTERVGVIAWSRDDRFVILGDFLASEIVVWDAASGDIVNVIALPPLDPKANLIMQEIAVDEHDRLTLTVDTGTTADTETCTPQTLRRPWTRSGEWKMERRGPSGPCSQYPYPPQRIASHDGRRIFDAKGNTISDLSGNVLVRLGKPEPDTAFGAALSPDGKRIALVFAGKTGTARTRVAIFDFTRSKVVGVFAFAELYFKVAWLDNDRLLLPGDDSGGRENEPIDPPSPIRILAAADGRQAAPPIPFRCEALALPDGTLLATGLGNCTYGGATGEGLERYDRARGWQKFGPSFAGTVIDSLTASPDGRTLVTIAQHDFPLQPVDGSPATTRAVHKIRAIDVVSGALLAEADMPAGASWAQVQVAPDGKSVALRMNFAPYVWDMSDSPPVPFPEDEPPRTELALATLGPGRTSWYEQNNDTSDALLSAISVADGKRKARVVFDAVTAEGPITGSVLRWVVTQYDGFVLWRPRHDDPLANPEVLRTYLFPPDHHFTVTPEGRYDTDLGADSNFFRWIVSDAPLQSLGSSAFMRNLFEPRLGPRTIACLAAGNCDKSFPPVRALASLNRVLPGVKIIAVKPGAEPNRVEVEIEVRGGSMLDAPNGRTTTEPFNLRLFRDGALVAQFPKLGVDEDLSDVAAWRARNLVPLDRDGTRRISLPVVLPTGKEDRTIALTAYAFNEDRVKSETARAEYVQPAVAKPRPRRAFVVTIGIDEYDDEKLLDLQFAASDARLLGERLARIPGYEVRRVTLAGDSATGKRSRITALTIAHTIAILRGVNVAEAKQALKDMGFDASMLEPPTPDDIVILSFAGHGWADKNGAFYIVPSDARWLAKDQPDRKSLISAVQMADRLRDVDAGEMAMIIDACHSAASVDGGGFKPGPMGDAGLGQLAFDKGIRILAATQADDVALEDPVLRQGLLTYALAGEGITASGGKADGDGDGKITLDEWLAYATKRMPSLSSDARLGRLTTDATGARGWVQIGAEAIRPAVQEPSLFDFNARPSGVVLKQGVRRE